MLQAGEYGTPLTPAPQRSPTSLKAFFAAVQLPLYHAAMLKLRLIFGPIMIVALLGLFYLDQQLGSVQLGQTALPPGLVMWAIFVLLVVLGGGELTGMLQRKAMAVHNPTVAAGAGAVLTTVYLHPLLDQAVRLPLLAGVLVAVLMAGLITHARHQQPQGGLAAGAGTLLAVVYMGLLGGFYLLIRHDHSAWTVAGVILVAKSTDIGAYFTGKTIGRHKLIPWLSPGKTWEGLAGGLIFTALVAVGVVSLLDHQQAIAAPWWAIALGGAVIGGIRQLGDLTASLFKRDAGIKDSGRSIPGFGGVIDVVDSALLVGPTAWMLLYLAGQNG